jgi:hypothetical protein
MLIDELVNPATSDIRCGIIGVHQASHRRISASVTKEHLCVGKVLEEAATQDGVTDASKLLGERRSLATRTSSFHQAIFFRRGADIDRDSARAAVVPEGSPSPVRGRGPPHRSSVFLKMPAQNLPDGVGLTVR